MFDIINLNEKLNILQKQFLGNLYNHNSVDIKKIIQEVISESVLKQTVLHTIQQYQ